MSCWEVKLIKVLQVTFRIKSTIEEESTENVVKTRRGRPPNKSSSELTLHELKTYVNEMKKVWEALESLAKELSKPSN